jgi:hypothetical protein
MKKLFLLATCILSVLLATAQKTIWKEMEDFHSVMSATFHPAEENKLQPVKDSATELLTKAKAWQKAAVPAGYKAGVTKPILKKLVQQCAVIRQSVKAKKTDAVLKQQITTAHDIFHEIMEKCRE